MERGERDKHTHRDKEWSEIIILLPVVQESRLKGKKHSILAENHILIGSIKFRRGMLGKVFSGVYLTGF